MGFWDAIGHWLTSPGFGGLAAVVAASIAYAGVKRSVRSQRDANRKQQWWERARWALDLTLSEDTTTRTIGLEVLDALGRSEYAGEHEYDVVEAAVAPTLEAYADETGRDYEDDGLGTGDEAHLNTDNDQDGDR
ncbi:hypothetical protein [Nocardioides sp. Root140]|uniref:hypothetical protein n=1 Tax=Nocardioides sp. Root140 TaxID=1736460 RepID=UPI0006F25EE8|nr:hypothetical protein [Nocardioides sp. Root140]KQY61435.1 hypothetical protein ASD30_25595 [Nocardioides sp. Root140]